MQQNQRDEGPHSSGSETTHDKKGFLGQARGSSAFVASRLELDAVNGEM